MYEASGVDPKGAYRICSYADERVGPNIAQKKYISIEFRLKAWCRCQRANLEGTLKSYTATLYM